MRVGGLEAGQRQGPARRDSTNDPRARHDPVGAWLSPPAIVGFCDDVPRLGEEPDDRGPGPALDGARLTRNRTRHCGYGSRTVKGGYGK